MKCHLPLLVLALLWHTRIYAQCPIPVSYEVLHANEIRAAIPSALELFTTDEIGGGFQIGTTPKEMRTTIYNSGIWLAGLSSNGSIKASVQTYTINDKTDFGTGPITGDPVDVDFCKDWDKVWKVTRAEIDAHIGDFNDNGVIDNVIQSIMSWPGRNNPHFQTYNQFELPEGEFAPFWDQNGDGIYNPMTGDYPYLFGVETQPDQMTWSVFNDATSATRTNPGSLNMQVERTTWAYYCDDNPVLNKTIFVRYKVINKGLEKLDSCFFGIHTDFDLGCFSDDYAGTSIKHNAVYAYNADNEDDDCQGIKGFQSNPPVQAMTILNKPLFASYIKAEENTVFSGSPIEIFLQLNGLHISGVPQTAEGDGYLTNGSVTKYSFSGDPWKDDEWSMFQEQLNNIDVRPLASVSLGSMSPQAIAQLDLAFLYVREPGKDYLENVTAMYDQLDSLHHWYKKGLKNECMQSSLFCTNDCVWPGDANNDGTANHYDLLAIGVNHGATGKTRPGLLNWAAKAAEAWLLKDQKHADADGNGLIDKADFEVTKMNYQQKRPDYVSLPDTYPVGPELSVYSIPTNNFTNITPGKKILANIKLTGVSELQGLAFSLEYDDRYFFGIDTLNNSSSNFQFAYADNRKHQLDFARYDIDLGRTLPANDRLYSFYITANTQFPSDITTDSTWLRFKNIVGIKSDGTTIPIGGTDLLAVFSKGTVATDPISELEDIAVFPNPASDQLTLLFPGNSLDRVQLFNTSGILVKIDSGCSDQLELDIRSLTPGIYFLKIEKKGYSAVKKIIVE